MSFYRLEKEGALAWIYLNRPEKKNAMGPEAWQELPAIFDDIQSDDEIRAVVIIGEGKDFCAGIDLPGMAPVVPALKDWDQGARAKVELFKYIKPMQECISSPEKCSKPVICALHGFCIGAGLDLASACDIRLATTDTQISLRETAVSFIADVGSLQRVPLIVGQGLARELAFTAKYIDAQRALQINLVNSLYDDKAALIDAARQMAQEIASNAPLAVQGSKEVLNYCRDKSVEAGLEYVAARSTMILPSEDMMETFASFMERRDPNYKGR